MPAGPPTVSSGSRMQRPITLSCTARWATSTRASGAGPIRRTRTSRRWRMRREASTTASSWPRRCCRPTISPTSRRRAMCLREALTMRGTDERALYLLSQAERRAGDASNAESAARRLIAQNGKNPRGYVALAEALEDQRRYQPIIDALAPAVTSFSGANDNGFSLDACFCRTWGLRTRSSDSSTRRSRRSRPRARLRRTIRRSRSI